MLFGTGGRDLAHDGGGINTMMDMTEAKESDDSVKVLIIYIQASGKRSKRQDLRSLKQLFK